jgi:hypothetical protein
MCEIIDDRLDSIKRVMNTNNYILKTRCNGLKLLTISGLESKQFIVSHLLEFNSDDYYNLTDTLLVLITPSHIVIAVVQNQLLNRNWKGSIKFMKIPIA